MDILLNLGISDDDFNDMLELFPKIVGISNEEIMKKINILKSINCDSEQIKNIFIGNPSFLGIFDDDILELISYLKKIGLCDINLLFEENPYFLDYEVYELEEYIEKEIKNGKKLEEIVEEIEINPYIMDEK